MENGTVVGPESQHGTGGDEQLVDTGETATNGAGRILRDVKGSNDRGGTDTETSDEATDEHDGEDTRSSGLEDATDDDDSSSHEKSNTATPLVSHPRSGKSTNEATALQGRDDVGLQVGAGDFTQAKELVVPLKRGEGQDTTDDTCGLCCQSCACL